MTETAEASERTSAIWVGFAWLALAALISVPALVWGVAPHDGPYGSARPFVQSVIPTVLALIAFARARRGLDGLPAWVPRLRYALHALVVAGLAFALVFYAWWGIRAIF